MASVKWNQDLNAGENWWTDLNLKNTAGANRNITNHTLASQIKRHYKSVEEIWKRLEKSGDIYLDKYSGWYSVSDEAYYDEDEIISPKGDYYFMIIAMRNFFIWFLRNLERKRMKHHH